MSRTIPALDLMFLLTETPNSPKHVGAVMTFQLPAGGGSRRVRAIVDAYRKATPIAPFNFVPEVSHQGHAALESRGGDRTWTITSSMSRSRRTPHERFPEAGGEPCTRPCSTATARASAST